jgi:uroporphyrinogen decarboxylase
MADMTPRERVWAALNHQEPDRVPLDIGGGASTTIIEEGYEKLKQHWGVKAEPRILNKIFRMARLDESVMQRLGSDCRPLGLRPPVNWSPPPSEPGTFKDIWGITWQQAHYGDGCYYWELAHCPLAEASVEDIERYPWPDLDDPGFFAGLAEDAKELYEETDYAIMADGGFKSFWELGYMLRGFEQSLLDVALNPEFTIALMDKLLEMNLKMTGRFLDAVGPYIQIFRAGDDLATQKGRLMSPASYEAILKPVYKEFFDFVKSKTDAKIFFHSCGNAVTIIDDLVEVGVDILNPVQVAAMGDMAEVKRRFGDKMVFWGGIDTQRVLPFGSVDDVEAEVKQRIRELGPGGGFVVAAVHAIQPDVSPENIIAMAEATRKYGTYPLSA